MLTNDVEHLFICLFAAHISFLVKTCSNLLTIKKNRSFVFLLLNFETSLYILDTSPLSDMHFAIFFSFCLIFSLCLTMSFEEQKFQILMKCSL